MRHKRNPRPPETPWRAMSAPLDIMLGPLNLTAAQ